VLEYYGEILSAAQYRERVDGEYSAARHFHCISLDGGIVIDGGAMGQPC
jgi:hypothetical protein